MLSLCTVTFLSASDNLVHHLCLEGKLAGHDELLLGTGSAGRELLACLLPFTIILAIRLSAWWACRGGY